MLRKCSVSLVILVGTLIAWLSAATQGGEARCTGGLLPARHPGTPAMSPDGQWVAFIKSTIVEAENRRQNELWLVASDGQPPARRLSDPSLNASSPRWSPNGKLLAFVGRPYGAQGSADGGASIWFLRMDQPDAAPTDVRGVRAVADF